MLKIIMDQTYQWLEFRGAGQDKLRERKHTGMDAIRELQDMVDDPENASIRKQIEAEIEFEQKLYDKINTVIKD